MEDLEAQDRNTITHEIENLVKKGISIEEAHKTVGVYSRWYLIHAPHISKIRSAYLMRKQVEAVEMMVSGEEVSVNKIAAKLNMPASMVSKALTRYFEKPNETLTLKSKI
jgi:hypothetical protein